MPEDYVVFSFFESEDEEFKRIIKNARRKLEIPSKIPIKSSGETCGTFGQHKTKYACIVEADESMRIRMEGSQSKSHEDHISGKGVNSLSHYNLVHKFIPVLEALKVLDAKAAVEKNG